VIESPVLPTAPTDEFRQAEIEPEYSPESHLSTKFFLLIGAGGIGYIAAFFGVAILAWMGYGLCAATAISIRKSGQTPQSAAAAGAAALLEIIGDVATGATDVLENRVKPIAAMGAQTVARHSGLISATEMAALAERQGAEVKLPESVIELIVGSPKNPHNTAILARRQSGKTTVLHGVLHYLLALPQKNIVIVGDPNYGAGNAGDLPAWGGLPIFNRNSGRSTIEHHHLLINRDDNYTALCQLGDLYQSRMEQANAAAQADRSKRVQFTPVYYFLDEFQTFVGGLGDDATDRVNAIFGDLIRAAKYQIFFFPVLHNDRAENGMNTTNLGGVNLLLLGSVVDAIRTDKALNNSRQRFDDKFLQQVAIKRIDYNGRYGKGLSQKKLGVINLVDGCQTSDGTEFAPGNHLLMVPDFRAQVAVIHDFSGLVQTTAQPQPAPAVDDLALEMAPLFIAFLQANRDRFPAGDCSVTKFFDTYKVTASNPNGWGRRRDKDDRHYAFLKLLAAEFGGRIDPLKLLENAEKC
jgi:hypothetical protein